MKVAVYGTLRKTGRLEYYLRNAKYLGTQEVQGYDMYSYGAYPYIIEGKGKIVVEVYEVSKLDYLRVGGMEVNAGYGIAEVQTNWGEADMFVYTVADHLAEVAEREKRKIGVMPQVISGDWIGHVGKDLYAETH